MYKPLQIYFDYNIYFIQIRGKWILWIKRNGKEMYKNNFWYFYENIIYNFLGSPFDKQISKTNNTKKKYFFIIIDVSFTRFKQNIGKNYKKTSALMG